MALNETSMALDEKPFLLIAAEHWLPWTSIHKSDDGNITISGPMAHVLTILATVLNFDYKIIQPPDHLWGEIKPDGTWSGMVGMLQRKEVAFAVGPFTVSMQRETACDMSNAISASSHAILQARPSLQSDLSGFLKPFTPEVWILVLCSIVSIGIAMIIVASSEGRIFKQSPTDYLYRVPIWVLQTLTQESSEWIPENDGGRILVVTWLLASLVFMSSYSGILTAMLTVPAAAIPIDSLRDLISQTKMQWQLERGFLITYFDEATGDIQKEVNARASGAFQDVWAVRQELVDGEFVALGERSAIETVIDWDFSTHGQCGLYVSRENVLGGTILSMAFQTKSPYLPRANEVINTLTEAGLLRKWLGDQFSNASHTPRCLKPLTSSGPQEMKALNMEDLSGPFLLLSGGLSMALLSFAIEVVGTKVKETADL